MAKITARSAGTAAATTPRNRKRNQQLNPNSAAMSPIMNAAASPYNANSNKKHPHTVNAAGMSSPGGKGGRRAQQQQAAQPTNHTIEPPVSPRRTAAGTTTPPKVNGVHGFMMASPERGKGRLFMPSVVDHQDSMDIDSGRPPIACRLFPSAFEENHHAQLEQAVAAQRSQQSATVEHNCITPQPQEHADNLQHQPLHMAQSHVQVTAPKHRRGSRNTSNTQQPPGSDLFSPYKCSPKHHYFTRAVSRWQETVDARVRVQPLEEQPGVSVNRVEDVHVHYHSETVIKLNQPAPNPSPVESISMDLTDLDTEEAVESMALVGQLNHCKALMNYAPKPAMLPPKDPNDHRVTLVLDLDETLVHCSIEKDQLPNYDLQFNVLFQDRNFHVFVQKRPRVLEFLKFVSELFEVVIFTASQKIYADTLLDLMDPERKLTKHRLFRDSCVLVDGTFVKDLNVLGRDLNKVIIVDNAIEAFSFQVDNGVPIKSWFSDREDQELVRLFHYLRPMCNLNDVRPYIAQTFGLRKRILEAMDFHNIRPFVME